MPTYNWNCKSCGNKYEALVLSSSALAPCVSCLSEDTEKMFTAPTNVGVLYRAGGFTKSSALMSNDPTLQKIERGQLTDVDIQEIKEGDNELAKIFLEKKADEGYKKKKELDHDYGKGVFDGVDNNGNLFKDISVAEIFQPSN